MKTKTSDRPLLRGGNFPLSFTLTFLIVAFGLLGAAVAQTYTRQNTRVIRGQFDCTYDASGTLTAVTFTGFLQANRVVNSALSTDVVGADKWTPVSFDLLNPALATTTVTAGGVTTTIPKVGALVRQLVLDQATAAGVP